MQSLPSANPGHEESQELEDESEDKQREVHKTVEQKGSDVLPESSDPCVTGELSGSAVETSTS